MKRTSIIFIALTVICIMVVMLAGCSKTANPTEAAQSTDATAAEAATEAAPESATDAAAETETKTEAPTESEASPLVGTWEYEEVEGFIYTFNADGTGSYDVLGEIMNFTYTDKNDSVEIMYEDVDAPYTAEYTIDGNTLIMKDSLNVDVKYIKK